MGTVKPSAQVRAAERALDVEERSLNAYLDKIIRRQAEALDHIAGIIEKSDKEINNFLKHYGSALDANSLRKDGEKLLAQNKRAREAVHKCQVACGLAVDEGVEVEIVKEIDDQLLQAFSYTIFDTILFSITNGTAPDFTLLSQSALFDTVYINIARGYKSYLFSDIPASAPGIIIAGRNLLEALRDQEESFLDSSDLWDTYAPIVQQWWINTALPVLFGERDPDWDDVACPTFEDMQKWSEGEFSRQQHFPAITDLLQLTKDKAVTVADTFDFKPLLSV